MGVPKPVRFSGESPSLDELSGGTPAQVNCHFDAAGAVRIRPGLTAWEDFPDDIPLPVDENSSSGFGEGGLPVTGMVVWRDRLVYACSDGNVFGVAAAGSVIPLSITRVLPSPSVVLNGGLRPVFAPTRTRLVISDGGTVRKVESIALAGLGTLGGSPPRMTHVTTIAQRIVGNANDESGILYWSNIGDTGAETWLTGLNFREAETKQDPVIGLYENANELVALGESTIQMLSPDPSETFTNARTIEVGWGSPHSYIAFDEIFAGLDSRSRAIMCNGRSFDVISSPSIGEQLEKATTSDAWGFRYKFHNWDLGAFMLPTDGRTFVYDAGQKLWTEWRGYDAATGGYGRFNITSSYYWAERKLTLVGLPNGRIAKFNPEATTDLGEPIICQLTSTFENHGSSRLKNCLGARLRFRRGIAAPGSNVHVLLSWRDDLGPFCEPEHIDLGDPADVQPVVEIRSLGTYRQRQWRIVVDSAAFRFSEMEEDVELLGH